MTKAGRPPKYREEFPELATQFCRLGATNADLAAAFKVSAACIDRWLAKKPEFRRAVEEGRELADARVANALFLRATGYSHPEVHVSSYLGQVTLTPIVKHHPPETGAITLWLLNRRPDLWRAKQSIELSGPDGDPIQIEAAKRIMEADTNEFARIMNEERARLGMPPRETEAVREFGSMIAQADAELGPVHDAEIVMEATGAPANDPERMRKVAGMIVSADALRETQNAGLSQAEDAVIAESLRLAGGAEPIY